MGKVTALAGILTQDDFVLAADGAIIAFGAFPYEGANKPKIVCLNAGSAICFAGSSKQAHRLLALLANDDPATYERDTIEQWWKHDKTLTLGPGEIAAKLDSDILAMRDEWLSLVYKGDKEANPPPQVLLGYVDEAGPHLAVWRTLGFWDKELASSPISIPIFPRGRKLDCLRKAELLLDRVEYPIEQNAVDAIRLTSQCYLKGTVSRNVMTVRLSDGLQKRWHKVI